MDDNETKVGQVNPTLVAGVVREEWQELLLKITCDGRNIQHKCCGTMGWMVCGTSCDGVDYESAP
ncbi:hypothetical protein M404DRAFT_992387 [Pisolithus tinctorius Marx 270]|uniref:Uncharacterized protein n=1 Tax=Pisolithus tinctorius Marx 270 TaxID=870435 RepID=A0A0C3JYA7_PISTI|nr:hypothetical protein M404DRAFT_992387 [Pisolithus tinctorius Marx 270]